MDGPSNSETAVGEHRSVQLGVGSTSLALPAAL